MAKRANREAWARRVREWEESGQSAGAFARGAGLNARTLSWWRWKLSQQVPEGFVEVTSAPMAADRIEVLLENGSIVRVPALFDDDALARIVAVVGAK